MRGMNTKQKILRMLRESGEYVSGQQICGELEVSRAAVWKAVRRLKEEGYPIEAVTNRGYRLLSMDACDLFNQEEVEQRLTTQWAGRPLRFMDEIDSTNAEAFRLSESGFPHGTLAAAGAQTAGRGRRGRTWQSPPGGNLYMSLLLKPQMPPEQAPMLTLAAALAVYEAVTDLGLEKDGCGVGIKWPNDIVVRPCGEDAWRKVCGILTEMRMEEREIRDIVIGIGINVNQDTFPEELAGMAGSLLTAAGRPFQRAELAAGVWKHFEPLYELLLREGSLHPFREQYESALVNRGREVRVLDPQQPYEGIAQGITDTGELLVLRRDTGETEAVGTGEVSVRGVNGYV